MSYNLVLDTHVWIWLVQGEKKLEKTEIIKLLEAQDCMLNLSAISLWEISMLVAKERLKLNMDTKKWLDKYLVQSNTNILPITTSIAVASTELVNFHGDLADRLILATSLEHSAILVTHDANILKYTKSKKLSHLKV